MTKPKLTVKAIRAAAKQLQAVAIKGDFTLPMRADIALTVGGVVIIPGTGIYLHPETFKDIAGEEAYQELLKRPRIICEYDIPEEKA